MHAMHALLLGDVSLILPQYFFFSQRKGDLPAGNKGRTCIRETWRYVGYTAGMVLYTTFLRQDEFHI